MQDSITHEALEALSKRATQGLLIVPERDAHTDRTSAHVSNDLPSVFVACAGKPIEQREADTLFLASLWNAYRTGQLIHAVPSETLSPDAIRDCLVTTVLATTAPPSGDEVEAVARKLAPFMEGGREYDQMPATRRELKIWSRNGMALINDATQDDAQEAATAAITALDAVRKARENGDG